MSEPLVEIRQLVKEYGALRPLRIQTLVVGPGEIVSVAGLDAQAAEILVTLVTGASLPDEGQIRLFGRATSNLDDSTVWLQSLDGIGMLSGRVVLLEPYSVCQNIALSLTLAVDPIDPGVRADVDRLAIEAGIDRATFDAPVAGIGADLQMRVRLARALALHPRLMLAEHPSATVSREAVHALGADVARIAQVRKMGVLAVTADPVLARALGGTRLTLDPATGGWKSQSLWSRVGDAIRR